MHYIIKKFEELTNTELYKILQLRQDIFIIEQACIFPDIDDKDEGAFHLMALDDGKIIGCIRILGKGISFEEVSIGRVALSASKRGRGIAKEMMNHAMSFIETELGEKRIRISSQSYVIPFYAGLGFKVVSDEYLEDDIPHVEMLCNLYGGGCMENGQTQDLPLQKYICL